jgi:nicotinamide-nucleotide amidase
MDPSAQRTVRPAIRARHTAARHEDPGDPGGRTTGRHHKEERHVTNDIIDLATRVGRALEAKGLLLATAESCTGGGVSQAITEIPGSTGWFECGFVTYSNASKTEMLDVPAALIAQFGSVSEEVAGAMAEGAIANSNAHVAVSTTGIAGPTGAVPGKPVGTVCFGWSKGDTTYTERLVFSGDRHSVREQTVAHALAGLLRLLE